MNHDLADSALIYSIIHSKGKLGNDMTHVMLKQKITVKIKIKFKRKFSTLDRLCIQDITNIPNINTSILHT